MGRARLPRPSILALLERKLRHRYGDRRAHERVQVGGGRNPGDLPLILSIGGPGRNRTAVPKPFRGRCPTRVVDDLSRPSDAHRRASVGPPGVEPFTFTPRRSCVSAYPAVNVHRTPPLSELQEGVRRRGYLSSQGVCRFSICGCARFLRGQRASTARCKPLPRSGRNLFGPTLRKNRG